MCARNCHVSLFVAALLSVFAAATNSNASIVGDTIRGSLIRYPDPLPDPLPIFNIFSPDTAIVADPGIEFSNQVPEFPQVVAYANFRADMFTVGFSATGGSGISDDARYVFIFEDLGWPGQPEITTGLELIDTDLVVIGYGWVEDSVSVMVNGYDLGNNETREASFRFHAVPEPSALAVWSLLSIVAFGGCYWRKCKR